MGSLKLNTGDEMSIQFNIGAEIQNQMNQGKLKLDNLQLVCTKDGRKWSIEPLNPENSLSEDETTIAKGQELKKIFTDIAHGYAFSNKVISLKNNSNFKSFIQLLPNSYSPQEKAMFKQSGIAKMKKVLKCIKEMHQGIDIKGQDVSHCTIHLDYALNEIVLGDPTISLKVATNLAKLWKKSNSSLGYTEWLKSVKEAWIESGNTNHSLVSWLTTKDFDEQEKEAWHAEHPNESFNEIAFNQWKGTQYANSKELLPEPLWLQKQLYEKAMKESPKNKQSNISFQTWQEEEASARAEYWSNISHTTLGILTSNQQSNSDAILLEQKMFEYRWKSGAMVSESPLESSLWIARSLWEDANPSDANNDNAFMDYIDRREFLFQARMQKSTVSKRKYSTRSRGLKETSAGVWPVYRDPLITAVMNKRALTDLFRVTNQGEQKFQQWKEQYEESMHKRWENVHTSLSFEEWKSQQVFHPAASCRPIVRLNEGQRQAYCTECNDGVLFRNGNLLSTEGETAGTDAEDWMIFVIGPDQKLYCGSHVPDVFYHSSFFKAQAVMAAGKIKTDKNGKIIAISNQSGHYRPSDKQSRMMLQWFEEHGVKLENTAFSGTLKDGTESIPVNSRTFLSQENYKLVAPWIKENLDVDYLDEHNLLRSSVGKPDIVDPSHMAWFLHEAIFLEYISKVEDPITRQLLSFMILQTFGKAAPIGLELAKRQNLQSSPLHQVRKARYYRSDSENVFLRYLAQIYAEDMKIDKCKIILIDSPLLNDFIKLINPKASDISVDDMDSLEKTINNFLEEVTSNNSILNSRKITLKPINFSNLLTAEMKENSDIDEIISKIQEKAKEIVTDFSNKKYKTDEDKIKLQETINKLQLFAFTKHKDQHVLLIPSLFPNSSNAELLQSVDFFNNFIAKTGFCLTPDAMREAWLKVSDIETILEENHLPIAKLATQGSSFPTVCKNFDTFMKHQVIKEFKKLSDGNEIPPYLKILPKITCQLLEGLKECNVDNKFETAKIEDLLQISYFAMLESMKHAILNKDNIVEFQNNMEVLHQQIQMILAVTRPHDEHALAASIIEKMTGGAEPIVTNLPSPQAYAKPSAMHCMASVIASVAEQKPQDRPIGVMMLEDCYYETADVLELVTKNLYTLNGDILAKRKAATDEEEAFDVSLTDKKSIDLFVCEFQHNISSARRAYYIEDIKAQVKAMVDANVVAEKFTVAIDTTLDLEQSEHVRDFLADSQIQNLINSGRLNVVLVRSGQKYDMLGFDNYYGGIALSINDQKAFASFNMRMDNAEDQLKGLSYQGLAHLQKYSGTGLDEYRQAIMENTQALYRQLPEEIQNGTSKGLCISKMHEKQIFLDIKTRIKNNKKLPEVEDHIGECLLAFINKHDLPLLQRASFGFSISNIVHVKQSLMRFTPGLEDEKSITLYATFFQELHNCLTEGIKKGETDKELAVRMRTHFL